MANLEFNAKLVQKLPIQEGQGKNGPWKKQDIIVETIEDKFPKKICVSIWGDKIDDSLLNIGAMLNIAFNVESREFNGRWYTDIKAWKVQPMNAGQPSGGNASMPPDYPQAPMPTEEPPFDSPEDDLPF
ncbi:DUF3127 domain-containing protein [Flammeovirgaceae bacterium KN852]|uniref:DUF3127 domain-containing protein n=2 Tax=Marinigracilibium pacificum TaxID=2729599 RepID=A0A848J5L9_9BACT|nr:DUF3127 domain-containing protein [Marinigracilibium pacificum]